MLERIKLGYTPEQTEEIAADMDATGTIEGAPEIKPEHLAVFEWWETRGGKLGRAPFGQIAEGTQTPPPVRFNWVGAELPIDSPVASSHRAWREGYALFGAASSPTVQNSTFRT
jgi:hypothetical protein